MKTAFGNSFQVLYLYSSILIEQNGKHFHLMLKLMFAATSAVLKFFLYYIRKLLELGTSNLAPNVPHDSLYVLTRNDIALPMFSITVQPISKKVVGTGIEVLHFLLCNLLDMLSH